MSHLNDNKHTSRALGSLSLLAIATLVLLNTGSLFAASAQAETLYNSAGVTQSQAKSIVSSFLAERGFAPGRGLNGMHVSAPRLEGGVWAVDIRVHNGARILRETVYVTKESGKLSENRPAEANSLVASTVSDPSDG